MAPSRWTAFVLLSFAVLAGTPASAQERVPASPAYRHGYYLFLADPPVMCEDCYVPLLLTADTLEEIAKRPEGQSSVLITTYERDSIWQVNGMVQVKPPDIESAPRILRVRKRRYRYQEVTAAEILRLLEHPMGTIPISRPVLHSDLPPGPGLAQLIAAFRAAN
jgi:hypothetical protein